MIPEQDSIYNESYATTGQDISKGMVDFAEMMIEDETIPLAMKNMFWGFLNKETILSRSDANDRRRAENRFAIVRNLYIMSQPQFKVNIAEIIEIQNSQHRNTVENNRSFGGFERQALTTSIKELRTPRMIESKDSGFLAGMKKRLGFSGKSGEGEHGGS